MNPPPSLGHSTDTAPVPPRMAVNAPWLIEKTGANSVSCSSVTISQEPLDETEPHIDRLTPQALIDALIAIDLALSGNVRNSTKAASALFHGIAS